MSLLASNSGFRSTSEKSFRRAAQLSLTVKPEKGEGLLNLVRRLAVELRQQQAEPLHVTVFGRADFKRLGLEAFRKNFGRVDWPITWVEGAACAGEVVAGIQVHAFTGDITRIESNGCIVGSVFTNGGARQCVIGGLTSLDKTQRRAEQTRQTLDELQSSLARAGFELADLVRTWFFLENILSWYDEFNRARTKIYSGVKFRNGSLPASTGVGAKNPAGTAVALAAWAFRPLETNSRAEEVASPLQCSAPAYGSSFSRAMELSGDYRRHLFISGTASIAPEGKTLWVGDVRSQVELTMEVVEAILHSRGWTLADLTRGTAYFKHAADAAVFSKWLAENRWEHLPILAAQCDVCRDDLLFEIEVDAEKLE